MKPILKREFEGSWFYAIPTQTLNVAILDAVAMSSGVGWQVKSSEDKIDKLDPEGYHIINGFTEDVYGSGWYRVRILSKQKSGIEPIPILVDMSPELYQEITTKAVECK